jgi:catechol 2,3-dioxygenase-like lactoylglutathione lyase family enzyme
MIQARRLGHAAFETPDLEKAINHYTEVAGLVVIAREKDRAFLATRIGQLAIELTRSAQPRCVKLAFEIAPDRDLVEVTRELSKHGVNAEQRSDSTPGIAKVVAFADPKGTTIELFSQWRNLGKHDQAAGAGSLKLGHLAFMVPDPKAIAAFYEQVLGFRVSDWIEDQFVFLRCNPDHHTVNFIRGATTTMHHFAFEVRDFAQIQSACELLGQKEIPIIWGPLRLGPGHNIAIFHKDQDGQVIEFYAELDRMLDEELGYFEPRPWHRDQPQRPKVWSRTKTSIWGLPPRPEFPRNFG